MSIQSVERAFQILQAVAEFPLGARLGEIAGQTGLPKSTVSRMLNTLEQLGVVERDQARGRVRIGRLISSLVARPSLLMNVASPWLQRLAEGSGETASLAIMEGDVLLYIAQCSDPNSNIQLRDWTGTHVPMLHVASPGKLFLAYDDALRERYFAKPLEQYTSKTITDIDKLNHHLGEVRQRGYAWVREEFERGLSGVSAPIFDNGDRIIAAINLYGPTFRLPSPADEATFSQLVVRAAAEITAQLI